MGAYHRIWESLGPKQTRYGSKDIDYGSPYDQNGSVMDLRTPTSGLVYPAGLVPAGTPGLILTWHDT